jgi:hypothetical protein
MKKQVIIRLSAGMLVICFLFTSVISRSFDPFGLLKLAKSFSEQNTTDIPLKSDSSLFDEEGEEKSERDLDGKEFRTYGSPVDAINELHFAFIAVDTRAFSCRPAADHPALKGTSLYLVHRSLQL